MSQTKCGPAYRVETPRLVARCLNPDDAKMFCETVDENLSHLRPWLSWTRHEPRSLEERVERLRQLRSYFDQGRDFVYGLFDPEESRLIGAAGLQTRVGRQARELAYWIHHDLTGQGLASEVAAALVRVAFEVDDVERVEVHCPPRNVASRAIPEKLGFQYEATLRRRRATAEGHHRDVMIWTLFPWDYRKSPARQAQVRAYDAIGRSLL
jgi:RimJ/RimL family protein N-acetyltransferase